jgi:hypothetical protein
MRALVITIAALSLTACVNDGYPHTGKWGQRNPPPTAAAGQVQAVSARQAREAQCKGEVQQKPGSPGTDPRDYKCKGSFS